MTTILDKLRALNTQKNTLSFIEQSIQRLDLEQMRLITDNNFDIDRVRISSIRDFLLIEKNEVQSIIDGILNEGVSGV